MARLTRTQKYAELRDKIAQDREESLKTQDLQKFENQLNNVKNQFGQETEPVLKSEEVVKPVYEEVKPQEDIKKVQADSLKSLDDILNSMMSETFSNEEVKPVEKPSYQQAPAFEQVQSIQPTIQQAPIIEEVIQKPEVKEEPVTEPAPIVNNEMEDTMEVLTTEVDSLEEIITDLAPEESSTFIVNPGLEKKEEPVVQKQEVANNDFINNTFDEVNEYNKSAGKTTLDELPKTIVDEVIHPERKETVEIAEFEDVSDDEFSNTVSLEIDKVLSEIKNQTEQTASLNPNTIVLDETVNEIPKAVEVVEEIIEHPVLTKTLEEEEPVVIKNISELNINKVEDVVDDTIPFNVQKVQEEDDDEEYEEEAPSKVLNVILGILIFVLIAVLGVIVYYILVAKGIIG